MTTPADWYRDPEDPAGLRYWDGASWTEHRAPAQAPAAPVGEHATSAVSLPDQAANVYATRPVEQEPAPEEPPRGTHSAPDDAQEIPVQPYDTHPQASYEPPPQEALVPWDPPMPSWDAPSTEQTYSPPPTQSFEPAPFAPPPGPTEPQAPPTGPSGDGPNKKLVFGILGGAAAILLALAVILAFVLIRQDEPTVTSSPTTSSSTSETTSTESTSESSSESTSPGSPTPPPPGAEGSDGDYKFSVASTDTGDTITSTVNEGVETTADGMYYVIHLNVANTGTSPLTFVATFQQLNAAGQAFPLDDEATAFLGGTTATIAPGEQVETALVYDVPTGTEPDSILLRADPTSSGVELPLR